MEHACRGDVRTAGSLRRHHHGHAEDKRNKREAPRTARAPEQGFLDNIIVGYAFGPKKMETMGLIMAEASKALSTFDGARAMSFVRPGPHQQRRPPSDDTSTAAASAQTTAGESLDKEDADRDSSAAARTHYFSDGSLSSTHTRASSLLSQRSGGPPQPPPHLWEGGPRGLHNNVFSGIRLSFLPDSNGFVHLVRGGGESGAGASHEGSSVTTSATAVTAATSSIRKRTGALSSAGSCSSIAPSLSSSPSKDRNDHHSHPSSLCQIKGSSRGGHGSAHSAPSRQLHPIRVSFVPIDLDTPLEEQHGGKFDVILHKMTEDILCLSKMRRAGALEDRTMQEDVVHERDIVPPRLLPPTVPTTNTQSTKTRSSVELEAAAPGSRALRRLRRLHAYQQRAQSCVLVDPPENILAVMSRADMAAVLSRCLKSVKTRGGVPVTTPRFRVVEDYCAHRHCSACNDTSSPPRQTTPRPCAATLAEEIDAAGFAYPLIAKPLTAAGTKSSHHMGIVLARDGLQHLQAPCLLQEYANHGETLFKVYVLGASVWVFARESLPNLPPGGKGGMAPRQWDSKASGSRRRPRAESYVEFARPAGGRYYVEFNSQQSYPTLSDFGLAMPSEAQGIHPPSSGEHVASVVARPTVRVDIDGAARSTDGGHDKTCLHEVTSARGQGSKRPRVDAGRGLGSRPPQVEAPPPHGAARRTPDWARWVTAEEMEPVTVALRAAFGLDLFGFDVLVQHKNERRRSTARMGRRDFIDDTDDDDDSDKEVLVVDVNYFPGYKEVPHFPSLLAQYLTQKAVESRIRNQV